MALRLIARRGHGATGWVLVAAPGSGAAEELAAEMESLRGSRSPASAEAKDADDLAARLAATPAAAVVSGLDAWAGVGVGAPRSRLRSRFARDERTALVLGREARSRPIVRHAPNFWSWLGGSAVAHQPDGAPC